MHREAEKGMLGFSEDIVLCVQEPSKWENDKQHHRVSPRNGGREGYFSWKRSN